MPFDHDLFVIGGGSGGVRAARIAAAEGGARVGLAEESRMGGTCVIRGCVPKKLMVNASAYPKAMQDAAAYGWDVQAGAFDWPKFRSLLGAELTRLETAYRGTLKNAGVVVHDARATLADAHTVRLSTGQTFTAKHILIATGGWPFVPDVPGAELAITSNEMFDLEILPRRAAIVGGGYIASEFACILNGLGVKVSQYYRGAQILRGFDQDLRDDVCAAMLNRGVKIVTNQIISKIEKTSGGLAASLSGGETLNFDQLRDFFCWTFSKSSNLIDALVDNGSLAGEVSTATVKKLDASYHVSPNWKFMKSIYNCLEKMVL